MDATEGLLEKGIPRRRPPPAGLRRTMQLLPPRRMGRRGAGCGWTCARPIVTEMARATLPMMATTASPSCGMLRGEVIAARRPSIQRTPRGGGGVQDLARDVTNRPAQPSRRGRHDARARCLGRSLSNLRSTGVSRVAECPSSCRSGIGAFLATRRGRTPEPSPAKALVEGRGPALPIHRPAAFFVSGTLGRPRPLPSGAHVEALRRPRAQRSNHKPRLGAPPLICNSRVSQAAGQL